MSWDSTPIVSHPRSLVEGVFEPSDRALLSQHRHQQANRVAPVQPLLGCSFSQDRRTWLVHREIVQVCDCALDGLFQFISQEWDLSTFTPLQSVPVLLSLFLGPFSALLLSLLSLPCRSARTGQRGFVTVLPPRGRSLSVITFSVQLVTDFSHQPSCFAVTQRCWNIIVVLSRILFFSADFASEEFLLHCYPVKVPVSLFFTPESVCHGEKKEKSVNKGASVSISQSSYNETQIHCHWRFNHQFQGGLDEEQQKKDVSLNERNTRLRSPRNIRAK